MLRLGLGSSTLLACGATVPTFLARTAAPPAEKGRILVVVQLDGGNDGLNTVVPYDDDEYRRRRPRLQVPKNQVHKIDDRVGLNPALDGLRRLLDDGRLAVVQSVGYPNPNRSHFESMAIWHTARPDSKADTPGWLARSLDRLPAAGGDTPALNVHDGTLPQALYGARHPVPTVDRLELFRRRVGVPEGSGAGGQRAALDAIAAGSHGPPGSLVEFVRRSAVVSYASSARLEEVLKGDSTATGYPEFVPLGRRLRRVAQLIKAGLTTSVYYTQFGDFDTHANQQFTHADLLRGLGDSLRAFFDDLGRAGEAGRVLVLVFSEFGR